MSLYSSAIRSDAALKSTFGEVEKLLINFSDVRIERDGELWRLFEYRNALITASMYLYGMLSYIELSGKSRGSALYTDERGNIHPESLDDRFIYTLEDETKPSSIIEVWSEDGKLNRSERVPRPIPEDDDFFERVWARYREDGCVF